MELYNAAEPVNLRDWSIGAQADDQHRILQDVWIAPGACAVLARNRDPTLNGGITPDYAYTNLILANREEDLILIDPQDHGLHAAAHPHVGTAPADACAHPGQARRHPLPPHQQNHDGRD